VLQRHLIQRIRKLIYFAFIDRSKVITDFYGMFYFVNVQFWLLNIVITCVMFWVIRNQNMIHEF